MAALPSFQLSTKKPICIKLSYLKFDFDSIGFAADCMVNFKFTCLNIAIPFNPLLHDAFKILCIWKCYGKLSICSTGANA